MEVIIEQNDSFCFSGICGKIGALLHHLCRNSGAIAVQALQAVRLPEDKRMLY